MIAVLRWNKGSLIYELYGGSDKGGGETSDLLMISIVLGRAAESVFLPRKQAQGRLDPPHPPPQQNELLQSRKMAGIANVEEAVVNFNAA